MKKILIVTASPRKNGNTNSLVRACTTELDRLAEERTRAAAAAFEYEVVDLYDLNILPCVACRCCQTDWSDCFCVQKDDMDALFPKVVAADLLVLATPVYAWYCTAPMKAFLDRCVYACNKYYDDAAGTHGGERGPALWAGTKVALITTCGYKPEKGADLLEEGLRRYCKHSQMEFVGTLVERHLGYTVDFMDQEKEDHAKSFARRLADAIKDGQIEQIEEK